MYMCIYPPYSTRPLTCITIDHFGLSAVVHTHEKRELGNGRVKPQAWEGYLASNSEGSHFPLVISFPCALFCGNEFHYLHILPHEYNYLHILPHEFHYLHILPHEIPRLGVYGLYTTWRCLWVWCYSNYSIFTCSSPFYLEVERLKS